MHDFTRAACSIRANCEKMSYKSTAFLYMLVVPSARGLNSVSRDMFHENGLSACFMHPKKQSANHLFK
jgi:hypothetical protein